MGLCGQLEGSRIQDSCPFFWSPGQDFLTSHSPVEEECPIPEQINDQGDQIWQQLR